MITVQNLNYTYPKTTNPVICDLKFSVSVGEIFGFLGPSGAGKSTTQKILTGLVRDYTGKVTLLGREMRFWDSTLYEQIGVGFELPNSYRKLNGLENLRFFRSLYQGDTADLAELLERVGLQEAGEMPVSQYSKGMAMRLNFARALLNKPRVLFLDEPTSGLDPVNARLIKDIIREHQKAGVTILLTTHDMGVADELCDRVAFIVDGKIARIDAPEALRRAYGQREVSVSYGENGSSRKASFPLQGLGKNTDFIRLLELDNIQSIHTGETTLEEVFIQVTGRTLV